jgi:TolB-like protein/tRNA A-37 threonylcarbamoyl transferase component Bud32/Tfp pilus assembly protein PilF
MAPSARQCSRCTAELSLEIDDRLCPACLIESGIETSGTGAAPAEVAASFPQRFGDYLLLQEIARGGQGVVYRARHVTLNREVALKMFPVHPWTSAADLERFRQEARVAAELDHPAIVPIFEVGEFARQHYFTMKLIDGAGLDRRPAGEVLSPRRAAGIVAEAARAVQHAHDRGVLHRDLKPGNLLLDAAGRPHLTDFGLAKLLDHDQSLTRTREVLGTPSYLAPEIAAGKGRAPAATTDIYGLGTVLYFLLTGHPPFAGGTTLETVRQVVETEPRRPRTWNPAIDRDLETICLKCLDKTPEQRYASAAALAEDLERWLQHRPIRGRPGGLIYRGRKWLRRHVVASVVTAALIVVTASIVWSVRRASSSAPRPSLAVIFHSADDASRSLAAEFSRNVAHLLSGLPGFAVAPRSSLLKWEGTKRPAEIGAALGVPVLLTGTVRQTGGEFHLDAELVDVASGRTRWTRSHASTLSAGAQIQAQVVRAVASELGLELLDSNRRALRPVSPANSEAWTHYLRGRQLLDALSEPNLLQGVKELEQAVQRDPNFAPAHAALAEAHLDLGYIFREPAGHFARAREHVRAALRLDETLPEALVADGVLRFFHEWDWAAAERSVRQAVLLDASKLENHACYLHCLETVGRADDALKLVRLAAATHPSSILIHSELGCASYYAARFDASETHWRDTLRRDPENAYLRWGLARTLAQQGKLTEAARELEIAQTKTGGDWAAIQSEVAYVQGRRQQRDAAARTITDLKTRAGKEYVDPYLLAMALVGIDETDETFRQLERAAQVRSSWIPSFPVDPKFASLRNDPRSRALRELLKLPPSAER